VAESVVRIRKMRVGMRHRRVSMAMCMLGLEWDRLGERVLVMSVVNMLVLVFQCFVVMFVHMKLSQMQPYAHSHKRARNQQGCIERLAQEHKGEYSPKERGNGKVGRGAGGAQMAQSQDGERQTHTIDH
jgi:hypothetical protein